jgi:competence protein ComEC
MSFLLFRFLFLGVLIYVLFFIWQVIFFYSDPALSVYFLDVGQGDAIFIRAPGGNQMLIDGGPSGGALERELGTIMPFFDRSLDVVVATHPDQDHIGGLISLFLHTPVSLFIESGAISTSASFKNLEKTIKEKKVEKITARQNLEVHLGKGVLFSVLFPDRTVAGLETNTVSIVGALHYGKRQFLLTGDSPLSIENYLVGLYGKNLKSDVLKLGHHGSRTSSGVSFLSRVAPEHAVISAGKNNRYGHPHEEVVDRLGTLGISVWRTDELGTLLFKTDGEKLTAPTR